MARRRTDLFRSPSVTTWPCHLHDQWSDSSCCFPGCIPDARNMGQLRTQHVSLFGRSFAQSVWCHIWITSICLPVGIASWPDPTALRTGLFSRTTPALGDSPERAMIHVLKVAQPGICSCLSIAVSVTLLLEIWNTACPRIWELESGAVDVAFQSRQLPCGPGTRGFSTLNLFRDLPVSFQHAFSFQPLSVLCVLSISSHVDRLVVFVFLLEKTAQQCI